MSSSVPPPVISPVKKSARLGKNRSLVKKSSRTTRSNSSRSNKNSSRAISASDTDRSIEIKIQKKIKSIHNKNTDKLWEEQQQKAAEKDKETSAKKAALDVFQKLHSYGEERYQGDHEEITKVYHMIEHDTIDFENFYNVLQEHYFDKFVTKQSALAIFNYVDVGRKGEISFDQLHHVYEEAVKHLGEANPRDSEECATTTTSAMLGSPSKSANSLPTLMNLTTTQKAIATLTDDEMILRKKALQRMNELKYKIQQKMLPRVKSSLENLLRETYKQADVNGDGNLSYDEFADWLGDGPVGLNVGFTQDDIRDITLACDADLDGGISMDEFVTFVVRKNKLDPRSFLNEKRQEKVNYMKSLRRRTLKNMRKKMKDVSSARTVDTDHSTQNELSTRLWYDDGNQKRNMEENEKSNYEESIDSQRESEDADEYNFSHLDDVSERKEGPRRLGHTVEVELKRHLTQKHNHRLRFYSERDTKAQTIRQNKNTDPESKKFVPLRRNMKKSFSSPVLSARSSTLRRKKHRSRRQRKVLETFVDIDSAEHHQLPGGDVNALYSKINFENMAKEIWSGRWDGRGRDFKPDWVNRLTFSRVGLGGNDGISPTSAMFQSENIRRKRLLNETAPITNPAGKFIDEDRAKMTVENDLRLIRKRFYLRKNRRAVRTHVKQMDHANRMAERARIFTKTSQQLRYLEVLNDIEERKINQTYQTKGLIKSPEAARMKAGSIQFFRPPSGREEKGNNKLQTGIGTRQAAIVNWAY